MAEIEVEITLFCNFSGVRTCFGHHGEQIVHLVCGLNIKLVGLEFHTVSVLNGLACLDAQQDPLHFCVLFAQIVGVIGGCHGDARFPGKLDKLRQDDVILFQTVIL